jgi:4-hydroxybenzoate polyprenyltransferase
MIDPLLKDEAPIATDRMVRQFAGLWLLFFGLLAFSYGYLRHQTSTGVGLAALAITVGISGLLRPAAIRPVFRGAMLVATPIGWIVSNVILAVLFFGLFTPFALFFRLVGRDALQRRRDNRETHWVPKATPADMRRYFRQS